MDTPAATPPSRLARTAALALLVLALLAGTAVTPHLVPPASAGSVAHDTVVTEDPVDDTPHVLDGQVRAIAVVGGTVVVGGRFSRVREDGAGLTMARENIFAFDAATGDIEPGFAPRVDGPVLALAPGPSGTVFVGGSFREVNGARQRGVAQLRLFGGARVPTFAGAGLRWGKVEALAAGDRHLYVGGRFPAVGGIARKALARVDLASGRVDRGFRMRLAGPRKGSVKVAGLALSPDGSRLVVDGNFTRVAGQPRHQIAMIDTSRNRPRLVRWATRSFTDECLPPFHTYMRDVDFSPDGSYFAVVTTGGAGFSASLCDTVSRWETTARGTDVKPTWVNYTGGDSLYAVAVTGAAVYVGGHQRWMGNRHGNDSPGPGAKARPGIAAVAPQTGRTLSWNPTRTRGYGVQALVATPDGLVVGSDTERLGHEYHGRLGIFPLPGRAEPQPGPGGRDAPEMSPSGPGRSEDAAERPAPGPDGGGKPGQGGGPGAPAGSRPGGGDGGQDPAGSGGSIVGRLLGGLGHLLG